MSIESVTRELLVRYLEFWAPRAMRRGRRATVALAADRPDPELVGAALRVFDEFADRLRGELAVVLAGPGAEALRDGSAGAGTPAGMLVHAVEGPVAGALPAALRAIRTAGSPLLVFAETDEDLPLPDLAAGRPAELLASVPPGGWADLRSGLGGAGFPLTAGVELVAGGHSRLLAFGTGLGRDLEAFKDELWAVDEYAGVRYRDPADPQAHLLDISLTPHPGPLGRELVSHLASAGPCTVTRLREVTLTGTVYRAQDTVRVLGNLLNAGTVTRDPGHGRLGGDVRIALAGQKE
jgi:hypothetical protein